MSLKTSPLLWLISKPSGDHADVTVPLMAAGYRIFVTDLDLLPPPPESDWGRMVVGIIVTDLEQSIATTQKLRVKHFDRPFPIVWLLSEARIETATGGLESGADACLLRPVDARLIVAQANSLIRSRDRFLRHANHESDITQLTDRLQKVTQLSENDANLAQRLQSVQWHDSAKSEKSRYYSFEQKGSTSRGVVLFDELNWNSSNNLDTHHTGCAIVEVGGLSSVSCFMIASTLMHQIRLSKESPAQILMWLNQKLVEGILPDNAIVSVMIFHHDSQRKIARIASAGSTPPRVIRKDGSLEALGDGGSLLGLVNTSYSEIQADLTGDDRLVMLAGPGANEVRNLLGKAIEPHRSAHGRAAAELIGRELCSRVASSHRLLVVVYEPES